MHHHPDCMEAQVPLRGKGAITGHSFGNFYQSLFPIMVNFKTFLSWAHMVNLYQPQCGLFCHSQWFLELDASCTSFPECLCILVDRIGLFVRIWWTTEVIGLGLHGYFSLVDMMTWILSYVWPYIVLLASNCTLFKLVGKLRRPVQLPP